MNVIRMVKLFGWEEMMSQDIDDKRRAELNAIWKLKMFNLTNRLLTYAFPQSNSIEYSPVLQQHHPHLYDARHIRNICEHTVYLVAPYIIPHCMDRLWS